MLAVRLVVAALAIAEVAIVLLSVLRSVVLPRAVPTRLARVTFLIIRFSLLARLRGRRDYETRDRVLALQAPLGLFAQLFVWALCIFLGFSALFWAVESHHTVIRSLDLAGSSMLTLGVDAPHGLLSHFVAFSAAGVGLTLLALVITYLPSVYGAFSRREAVIAKLVVRVGSPPTGLGVLWRSWHLGRFDRLEEVWEAWEDWFIEISESHTTFPQLVFFRSPHPRNHWVLSAEAVLDGAALLISACDVERQSRSELCIEAGVGALDAIAEFLGVPERPPPEEADTVTVTLPRDLFGDALRRLGEEGVPLRDDEEAAWEEFRRIRARYEPAIAVLGRMTDAPRSDWSSWSEETVRHSPPLVRLRPS